VYTSWCSPVDVTLANYVPADELIYFDGDPCDLADEIASRLVAYGQRADAAAGIETPSAVA